MPLNKTTNIKLEITAKTANKSSLVFAGLAVPQELKVNVTQPSYGNTTIVDNKIIKSNTTTVSTVSYTGRDSTSEVSSVDISSIIPYNKLITIATVTVTADSNYAITKKPVIVIKSNNKNTKLFLQPTSVLNKFNINCISSEANLRNFKAELIYGVSKVNTTQSIINKISIDSTIVEAQGNARDLKIYGTPNTPLKVFLLDSNDDSVLNNTNDTDSIIPGVRSCISSSLDNKGYFTFKPRLPKLTTVRSTTVNGDFSSGASTIIFTSLADVLVGDEILFDRNKSIKVIATNVDGNANKCTLSESLSLANTTAVSFKRGSTYKLHVTSTGAFNTSVDSSYPTISLNQALYPTLTISASDTNVNTIINGGVANTTNVQAFTGRPDKKPESYKGTKAYNVVYTLTGRTFSFKSAGLVASSFVTASGDTDFTITSLSTSGNGTSEFKIFATLIINKWGLTPLTSVTLNLNNII